MGSTFNPQILMEKLAKLNSSQQSIETLSHWCIFHMNKAKQVVETWDKQFHCSPAEQRLAYLYLANDILQNSRRKGSEFVGEFWKVLPEALRYVMANGDEFGRNAALRLINIWEERKVFGSRGQILKEDLLGGRHMESSNRNGKPIALKLKHSAGEAMDKIVSGYQELYGGQLDEDAILSKCRGAISCVVKVDKEIGGDINSGKHNGSVFVEELQGQHAILKDSIEQLRDVESSRANLVSHLRDALQQQEFKLDQVRNELQAAQSHSEKAGSICRQLLAEQNNMEPHTSKPATQTQNFSIGNVEKSAPVMYTRQVPFGDKSGVGRIEDDNKSAAAAVAAKLTASTSSAQMLTYVLSSLASEGVIGNGIKKSSAGDYPSEKRPKLDNNDHHPYIPPPGPQAPLPPYPHPDSVNHNVPVSSQESTVPGDQPPPPTSSPPMAPLPPMPYPVPQFMQPHFMQYGFGTTAQQQQQQQAMQPPPSLPAYGGGAEGAPPVNNGGLPPFTTTGTTNPYQSYQGSSEGGFYSQPTSLPTVPISWQ